MELISFLNRERTDEEQINSNNDNNIQIKNHRYRPILIFLISIIVFLEILNSIFREYDVGKFFKRLSNFTKSYTSK